MRHGLCTGSVALTIACALGACDAGSVSNSDAAAGAPSSVAGAANGAAGGPSNVAGSAGAPAVGGASGGAGGGSAGAGIILKAPSSYPQNSANAKYPYPQGHASAFCAFPKYSTDQVATAYNNWKAKFFVGGKVIRPENSNDVVSEGIAYGMLIGVFMNDQPMFDSLWAYAQSKLNGNGLMDWHHDSNGGLLDGGGGATDADEDMAYALLMAGVQWGATYNASAVTLINNIWNKEIEGGAVLKPGDNFGGSSMTNPSYFAPSYYRAFAKATPAHDWPSVVESSYNILSAASGADGLVPNWVNSTGQGVDGPGNDVNGQYFGYDACRTPFRIALDYCQTGEPRAKAYLEKIVTFMNSAGGTRLAALKDGYTATGTNPPGTLGDYAAGMAFYGPAGVAAMVGGHDNVSSGVYISLALNTSNASATTFNYFHGSWGVLSLLAMSGNYWDMTAQ